MFLCTCIKLAVSVYLVLWFMMNSAVRYFQKDARRIYHGSLKAQAVVELLFAGGVGLCRVLFHNVSSVWLPAEQERSALFGVTLNKQIPNRAECIILKQRKDGLIRKWQLLFGLSAAMLHAKLSEKFDTLVQQICEKCICWRFHTAADTISTRLAECRLSTVGANVS